MSNLIAFISLVFSNIAVYLPRQLDLTLLLIVMAYFTALLFYIFYIQGGPIQKVVLEKTGTRYALSLIHI